MTASKTDNASYQIQIYTDLTDPKDPASGVPAYAAPFEYTQALAGIDTVTLPEPVMLTPGSQFSVVLTLADSQISYGVNHLYENWNDDSAWENGEDYQPEA